MTTRLSLSALAFALLVLGPSMVWAATHTILVDVVGPDGQPAANQPVFLMAARARGPFEPRAPKPEMRLTGVTDAQGTATFTAVPDDLAARNLRLHATVAHSGMTFESAPSTPVNKLRLKVRLYERRSDADTVVIDELQMFIEPWEGYLVFSQAVTLRLDGDLALDTSALPGERFEKGLPIVMPLKAKGIQVMGRGEHEVIESTVYWRGVLRPGERVPLQIRFSMSAHGSDFVYSQQMTYPADKVEIAVPLVTRYSKVPRLDRLELRAPDHEVEAGRNMPGLRADTEFLVARRSKVGAGDTVSYQLRGLPFKKPITPWLVFGLALLGIVGILVYGRRESRRMDDAARSDALIDSLQRELDDLFDELAELELDHREGHLDASTYEAETMFLRERVALLLKKLDDLRAG